MMQHRTPHDPRHEYLRPNTDEYSRLQSELLANNGNEPISSWRIFKIMAEFVNGFEVLQHIGKAASIFGSARTSPDMPMYYEAERLGRMLAEEDFTVITGGGGGVMEAANKGAFEAGGKSVGLNIRLPQEQALNDYVNESATFHYFFTRKVSLAFSSEVYIYFPGGFGTLDEFYEITTLVQTKKIQNIPVVLIGREFWSPLIDWMRTTQLERYHTIAPADLDLFKLFDSADEAMAYIREAVPDEKRHLKE